VVQILFRRYKDVKENSKGITTSETIPCPILKFGKFEKTNDFAVQSRFAETLTLTLNPNFGETVSANREDTDFAAAKAAIAATYGKTQDHGYRGHSRLPTRQRYYSIDHVSKPVQNKAILTI